MYSKRCSIALCLRILVHLIYHKDKTGVVYQTGVKLVLCFQKGAISPMSLHIAASDISQGQNWCCTFKNVQYRLCHSILLHSIYHKDKTGVVYSEICNIALCHCILLHSIYHKDKIGVVYSKSCSIALCLCILLHLLYHKDIAGVV